MTQSSTFKDWNLDSGVLCKYNLCFLLFLLRLKRLSDTEGARSFVGGKNKNVASPMQDLLRSFHDLAVNDTTASDLRTYLRAYLAVQASTTLMTSRCLLDLTENISTSPW